MSEPISDEMLMTQYQKAADEKAFDELFRRYSSRIMGYVMKRIPEITVAEDVLQQTFLKLHASKEKYTATYHFAPWIFTICRNTLFDVLRKRRHLEIPLEGEMPSEDFDLAPDRAQLVLEPAHPQVSQDMLDRLPETQKQAIELRYLSELSFEEIAKRLNTSPDNTRQLISRGIRKLRVLMKGKDEK